MNVVGGDDDDDEDDGAAGAKDVEDGRFAGELCGGAVKARFVCGSPSFFLSRISQSGSVGVPL